eukprot:3630272-Rhodomonas_salina.1
MVDGATRMDLFDCSVCGCNRPGGNSSLNSSSSAETYEKWAKATASKRTHRDGTVISKLATPRVPEAKQQDDQLEISVEEDVKAGKANVMQRSLSEGTNEPIGAGDGPSTQPGRTESGKVQCPLSHSDPVESDPCTEQRRYSRTVKRRAGAATTSLLFLRFGRRIPRASS